MNTQNKQNEKKITDLPEELKDFNWAAFFLTFIWGFKYKAWITFLAIPLIIIQLPIGLNWMLLIALQLYCGIKGNEWAYKQEYWKKSKNFRITQMKWAAVALALYIICPLFLLNLGQRFFKKSDNIIELLENAQCVNAYKTAKNDLQYVTITINSSGANLISQLNRIYMSPSKDLSQIEVKNRKSSPFFKDYKITAYKDENTLCSVEKQNCVIIYSYSMPQYNSHRECTFYFDNYKRLTPNETTKTAINKGLNIFKYIK